MISVNTKPFEKNYGIPSNFSAVIYLFSAETFQSALESMKGIQIRVISNNRSRVESHNEAKKMLF